MEKPVILNQPLFPFQVNLNVKKHLNSPLKQNDNQFRPIQQAVTFNNGNQIVAPNKIGPYQLYETIGEGAFSVVKVAVDVTTGQKFACKIVPKKRLVKGRMESRFENEIRILQKLDHPNITVLFDMLKDTVNYYVIMELCSTGTLFDYIIEHRKMPEDDGKYVFKQIMTTLKYMQSEGIAHRDIKPENILIDDKLHIKFIDFGFSDVQIQNHLMRTRCGSSAYASPECLNGGPYNGLISDIWSAGVVLYTMLNGKLPWTKDNLVQLTRQISDAEFFIPTNLSDDVRDLINGMMNADVQKRYTVDQILDHPWLKTVQDPDFTNECHIKKSLGQEEVNSFFSLIPSVSANQIFNKSHLVDLSSIRSDTMHDGRCLLAMVKRRKLTGKRCVVPILTSHRNNLSCAQLL